MTAFRDYADKSFLRAPATLHQQRLAASRAYLNERRLHALLPRDRCALVYVGAESGSRVLNEFRLQRLRGAAS